MLERFGATVRENFWRALGNIIIPDSAFSGLRLDKIRPQASKEMQEALRPKKSENSEDFPLPVFIDLGHHRPARMDPTQTSVLTAEEIEKKRRGNLCPITCALIALSNEAIVKNPQNLATCSNCRGEGTRTQNFSTS
ncbi:MAG: hypothetical protein V1803_00595 [Candidatus Roizmanbacteria bacterium]